jgi:hypothetical protein
MVRLFQSGVRHHHPTTETGAEDQKGGSDSGEENACVRWHGRVSNSPNERANPEPVPAWEKQATWFAAFPEGCASNRLDQ